MNSIFKHAIALASVTALSIFHASADETVFDFQTFPEGAIYAHEINKGLHLSDLFLHNISIINRSDTKLKIEQISFSVTAGDSVLNRRIIDRDSVETSAERFHRNAQFGVFDRLPELFGHDVMFDNGEELSPTAALAPQTALIRIQEYFAYPGTANALEVTVSYSVGDRAAREAQALTQTFSIPVEIYQSENSYRLPVAGRWYVSTGPDISSHHRVWQNTEFAYDFARTRDGGMQHKSNGYAPSDYYAYGESVFAVDGGIVTKAIDRFPDAPLRKKNESITDYQDRMSARMNENFANDPDANYGNIVVIDHENGDFSSYAHLKRGSVRVKAGERVGSGHQLGQVGQSGNSLKPHLHFAVALKSGRSVPVTFSNARSLDGKKSMSVLREGSFVQSD